MSNVMNRVAMRRFHLGVDLGQRKDHTAVVVIEESLTATGAKDAVSFEPILERRRVARHVERIALGTQFERVITKLKAMTLDPVMEGCDVTVCVDATGLGAPVVEGLRYAGMRGELMPVVFTGGQESRWRDGYFMVPKGELLHGLALEFERKELGIAAGVEGVEELLTELKGLRKEYGSQGVRWKSVGQHDDLAMALALAAWAMRRRPLPVDARGLRLRRRGWDI